MARASPNAGTWSATLRVLRARLSGFPQRAAGKPRGVSAPSGWQGRAVHAAVAFLVVLAAYWFYAWAIVGLIEPSVDPQSPAVLAPEQAAAARQRIAQELSEIAPFFAPGAWELEDPKILESDNLKLLMGGYRNLGDGRVRIQPCTIIFLPHGGDADPQRKASNVVILQAPQGALLRFDQPLNLRRMKIGRLVSGVLEGQIVIRSAGRAPGPEDDLRITTRDIQLTERSIWTAAEVDFSWGPHYGRGRELRISLIPGPRSGDSQSHGPSVAGVESFELRFVERLHLELGRQASELAGYAPPQQADAPAHSCAPHQPAAAQQSNMPQPAHAPPQLGTLQRVGTLPQPDTLPQPGALPEPGTLPQTGARQIAAGQHAATSESWAEGPIPAELSCRGPFRFDVAKKVATFEDRVNVWRVNLAGQNDQLLCDRLSIFFEENRPVPAALDPGPQQAAPTSHRRPPSAGAALDASGQQAAPDSAARVRVQRLVPRRVEARGSPVVLTMPSQQVAAQGERLEYDFAEKRIVLDSSEQVWLRRQRSEIHARTAQYQFAAPGQLGRLSAAGAGWLRAEMDEKPALLIEARWMNHLLLRPDEQNQLLSLTGGTQLNFPGIGRLDAQEVHLWLIEQPAAAGARLPRLLPDRLLARDAVRVDSTQLSARVAQLELWFEPATADAQRRVAGAAAELRSASPRSARLVPVALPAGQNSPPGPPLGTQPQAMARATEAQQAVPPPPGPHFELSGRLLQARIRAGSDQRGELAEVTVEDNVELRQPPTWESEELRVSGQYLHALAPQRPDGVFTISGQPARLSAKGLHLAGPNIHLNRGTNRLWVEGPGDLQLPLSRQLDGRPIEPPGVISVQWQDSMVFDGQAGRFETAVFAQSLLGPCWRQRLWTETLEVRLSRRLDFADPQHQPQPELQQVFCRGGVSLESRDFDAQGQVSHERFEAADLALNLQSGALTAGGPGWFNSVRAASQESRWSTAGLSPRQPATTPGATGSAQAPSEGQTPGRKCLHVRFQDSVQGDLHHGHLTFLGQVSTTYAPAESWVALPEADDPGQLEAGGVNLRCQRLSIWQMSAPEDGRRVFEVEALGNPVVEGRTFAARAIRISYAQGKDLLVLEGDGGTDAELYYQAQIGGPTSQAAARRIFFWPRSNRLKVDGARSLELTGFSLGQAGP